MPKKNQMSALTSEKKSRIFAEFGGKETNTGSIADLSQQKQSSGVPAIAGEAWFA